MRQAIRFLLLGLMTVVALKAFSQMPVQVTPQLLPPYSLQVSEYYSGVQPKLQVLLINRDINQPNIQVKLRMTVESQNCRLRTKDNAQTPTLTLTNGIPYYLTPQELQPFFSAANIDFTGGYSEQEYVQTGRFPEGLYSFYFEAFELYSGNLVSNKGFSLAWLTLADPPLLNTPAKAEGVAPASPQNIIFNWTPRHNTSPTAAYFTDYVFTLVEYNDTQLGPEASFTSSPPLFIDSVQTATTMLFGPGHPQLVPGKRYAWRVQAKAKSGAQQLAMFRNNGFSEVHWFTYQNNCAIPLGISATVQGQRVTIEWQNNIQHLEYKVEYREKNNVDAQWFTVKNTLPRVMLTDLKPGTQYEYRVGGACMVEQFSYSALLGFTTSGANANYLPGCGDSTLPAHGSGNSLQVPLVQGDVIKAGSFDVIVGYSTGTGSYSGTGYVIVPWLANAKVEVRFTSITLALDKKLLTGIIETTYDPSESGIDDIDEYVDIFTGGYGVGGVVTGEVTADTTFGFVIKIPDGISVQLPTGYNPTTGLGQGVITISVIPQGGGTPVSYTVDQLPTTIKDKDGNLYQVNKQGQVVPLGKPGGMALLEKTNTKNIDVDKAAVKFVDYPDKQVYAFDEWKEVYKKSNTFNKEYERLNGDYYVSAKAIAPGKTDYLKAVVTITDNSIIADSIKFVNGKGTIYSRTKLSNGVYEIAVVGGPEKDAQEVYALYEQAGAKTLNFGKVLVASYPKKEYKVTIVPVNSSTNKDSIAAYLKRIYAPLNIWFEVEKEDSYPITTWDLNNDGKIEINSTSIMSNYSSEMKSLIQSYRSDREIDSRTAYLFVLKEGTDINTLGEMPRGQRFGFIFSIDSSITKGKIAAHEIAHGHFKLKHTFDGYGFEPIDLPNNLLNYNNSGEVTLTKYQWDLMHDPALVMGMFDNDEDAKYVSVGIKQLEKFQNKAPGKAWDSTYTFLSAAGRPITLPKDITNVVFSTADPFINLTTHQNTGTFAPVGGLDGFWRNNKYFNTKGSGNTFLHYKNEDGEEYIDIYSNQLMPEKAVVAFGWYEEEKLGFDLYWVKLRTDLKYEANYKAAGIIPNEVFSVVELVHPKGTPYAESNTNSYLSEYMDHTQVMIQNWIEGIKGESITSFREQKLSPVAEEYLRRNQAYTKRGSLYAPILIANAYWLTAAESVEIVVDCQAQDALTRANAFEEAKIQMANRNPWNEMESYGRYTVQKTILELEKELEIHYQKFRVEMRYLESLNSTVTDINTTIKNATDGDDLADYLKNQDICVLEKVSIDNRIKAIELLEIDNEEEQIIRLIESMKYNGQAHQLINKVFSNNSALFHKLWNTIDGSDFSKYINYFKTLTENLSLNNNGTSTKTFSFELGEMEERFGYKKDEATGEFVIRVYKYGEGDGDPYLPPSGRIVGRFKPDEIISIKFVANSPYIQFDETGNAQDIKSIPAFYVPYLIWCKNKGDQAAAFKAIRVIANVAFIAMAIPTGGGSLTLVGAVSIAVSTTDIVITLTEDELQKTVLGRDILAIWNVLQWADPALAGVNGFKKLITTAGRQEFKFTIQTFLQDIKNKAKGALDPIAALRSSLFKLDRMGMTYQSALLRQKLLSEIDDALLKSDFVVKMPGAEIKLNNLSEATVAVNGVDHKLFDIEFSSQGSFASKITFEPIAAGDQIVGTLTKVRRAEESTSKIIEESVDVYFRPAVNGTLAKAFVVKSTRDVTYHTQNGIISRFKNTIASETTKRKGNFGEMCTDVDFTNKGYTYLHGRINNIDAATVQGIDGVFQKGDEFFIVESKFGSSGLSTLVDGTKQMSDAWINGGNRLVEVVGSKLAREISAKGYKRVLANIGSDGVVQYKLLDANGNVVGNFTP